jgi:hypothetical protein
MSGKLKIISLSVLTIFISTIIKAQEYKFLPEGLGLSNQLEYSNDVNKHLEIFENWLNLDYHNGIFGAGIRFEAYEPNDPSPAISRGKDRYAEIAYKYIKADIGGIQEGGNLIVGNYYALFGRGLVLKSYEDRNIRVDNNLVGAKLEARYAGIRLTALTGMASNANNIRTDILHAADIEYKLLRKLKVGASFAANLPDNENAVRTTLTSLRIVPSIWNFDFYGEYGFKQNRDIRNTLLNPDTSKIVYYPYNKKDWKVGQAAYGSMNFYYDAFAFSGEYKYYDNFTFSSQDGTIIYNTPPSVRKEYTYVLLNRHPSALNQSDEQGYQFEINYNPSDETYFSADYGETKTLSYKSYYKRLLYDNSKPRVQLREIYAQAHHDWNDNWTTIAAFGYNEERDTDTKNVTPILENRFYFDEINTIKITLEHQQTTVKLNGEQYYDDALTLEYLRSPVFSVSVVSEMQTREPEADRIVRKFWSFIQFGYKIGDHTDVSLLFGTRQAGNICIGGVCRYEPEFSGIEFKMFTRF